MPGRVSKYSKQFTSQITFDTMEVLDESPEALTIKEICARRISLNNITSQKMARVLNHLVEMGLAKKAESKKNGRMMYKSVAVMEAQEYEI